MMALPPELAPVKAYLDRATELRQVSPVASHQLRVLAMTVGLKSNLATSSAAKQYLGVVMDTLEEERKLLPPNLEHLAAISSLANDLSQRAKAADQPDATPNATQRWTIVEAPRVAQALHASAVLFDACRLFAPLDAAAVKAQEYAHVRSQLLARQLARALSQVAPCVPLDWAPARAGVM